MSHKSIQLVAAITNRRAGNKVASIFHIYNHEILLVVRGHDTASLAVTDCLGLGGLKKDLALDLSNKLDANHLFHVLGREMEFYRPEHGIAFTLSLSGISPAAIDILSRHEDQTTPDSHTAKHKEDISVTSPHSYELIASVIHIGLSAPVMEAARKTGCQGGTLIKVGETGTDAGKKLSGMALSQEEAILLTLTPADLRLPILRAIYETVAEETGEHAVAIFLLVDAVEGLVG